MTTTPPPPPAAVPDRPETPDAPPPGEQIAGAPAPAPRPGMPAGRIATLIVGGLLAALVTAVVALTGGLALASQHRDVSRSLVDETFSRVVVETGAADVTITSGGDQPGIEMTTRWYVGSPPQLEWSVEDGTLTVGVAEQDGWLRWGPGIDLRIEVGEASITTIDASSGAGNVAVRADATHVEAHSGVGNVTVEAEARTVTADSDAGNVRLDLGGEPAAVSATSEVGNVHVTVPAGSYRVDATTDLGNVDNAVADDLTASATIAAHSNVGNVSVDTRD